MKFGNTPQFRYSEARAARSTRWMFKLAGRYDTRRRGTQSRISRVFIYQWFGAARFDAGLVNRDGSPRAAYNVLASHARSHR